MVLAEVTSPAMTSASPKIHSGILNRFDVAKPNCDVMPACVATSFSHLNNEVYKSEYVRDEQDSESSSPEFQRYETYKKSFQFSQPRMTPDSYEDERNSPRSDFYREERKDARAQKEENLPRIHGGKAREDSPPTHLLTDSAFARAQDQFQDRRVHKNENRNNNSGLPFNQSKNFPNSPGKERVANVESASERTNGQNSQPASPKHSHPLKKRILFGESSNRPSSASSSTPSEASTSPTKELIDRSISPSAFRPHKPSGTPRDSSEPCNPLSSSDILRQMYAAFGNVRGFQDPLTRFHPGHAQNHLSPPPNYKQQNEHEKFEGAEFHQRQTHYKSLSSNHHDRRESEEKSQRNTTKRNYDPSNDSRSFRPYQNPDTQNSYNSKTRDTPSNHVHQHTSDSTPSKRPRPGSLPSKNETPLNEKTKNSHNVSPPLSSHSPPRQEHRPQHANVRNEEARRSAPKRAHHSHDAKSSRNRSPGRREEEDTVTPPKEQRKRARYSSSDSGDSQAANQQGVLPDFYKQGGHSFPYMNPMFYPPALASFGFPTAGFQLPIQGIPQTNPLMFGASPYLANPLLLREMLNQASLMSMLPNPAGLASLGVNHGGFSIEQLQAFQQLQNAALYQKPGAMLNPNGFPPSAATALSAMQNPLIQAVSQRSDSGKSLAGGAGGEGREARQGGPVVPEIARGKGEKEARCHKSRKEPQSPPDYREIDREHKSSAGNLARARNISGDRKSSHGTGADKRPLFGDAYQSPYVAKQKNQPLPRVNLPNKVHSAPIRSSLKKRAEKKPNEKSKTKGNVNRKLLSEMTRSMPFQRASDYKDEEDMDSTSENSPSMPGISGAAKPVGYKNLTRERRLVANARERTRVHTISSAFDELRTQIPSYSCNQKLSKLAILRIACSYIRTLSVLAGRDETTTFPQGVDQCTKVLQSESRARSRRKSNKAQIEWEMVNYERHRSRDDVTYDEDTRCKGLPSKVQRTGHSNQNTPSTKPHKPCPKTVACESPGPVFAGDVNDDVSDEFVDKNNDIVDVESIDEKTDVLDDVTNKTSSRDIVSTNGDENVQVTWQREEAVVGKKLKTGMENTDNARIENSETAEICVE